MKSAALERFRGLPRLRLGCYPAPVEEMPRLRAATGSDAPRLFIKREDYAGPGFGGNKVRKLEYVFAEAQRQGVDTVLTIGTIRSNHARVTAAFAARLGMECHLILNGKSFENPASRFLDELYGATIHPVSASQIREATMRQIAEDLRAQGRTTMEIPLGASDVLGAAGYIGAALEIAESGQTFDAIFHCSSSGGTQAGLDAGLQLIESPSRLIGVSCDNSGQSIAAYVSEVRDGIAEFLGLGRPALQRPLEVDDRFTGPGYGVLTPESQEALRLLARTEGIVLDPVYTAKAMAALLARVRAGEFKPDQSILFLHTGGQLALFAASTDV
jgi:D-cysteine desulfhydrase family pyridoxal phosphate-dependent enzyme